MTGAISEAPDSTRALAFLLSLTGVPHLYGTLWKASLVEGLQRERCGPRRASSQEPGDFLCCKRGPPGASLAVQKLGISLAMQGTWVQSLVSEQRSHTSGQMSLSSANNELMHLS